MVVSLRGAGGCLAENGGASVRCFLALPLPASVCRGVAAVQSALRATCGTADVRWSRPEVSHLTLQFLDFLAEDELLGIHHAIDGLADFGADCGVLGFQIEERYRIHAWVSVRGKVGRGLWERGKLVTESS